jgi:predicted Zn-ribbon and HTH transcriptional regulator
MQAVQKYEVAHVFKYIGNALETQGLTVHQLKTIRAIKICRTKELGGHIDACTDCGTMHISYNSCRNRHCPKCQGHKRAQWIQRREQELLPVAYFHVVFTLPSELNPLCLHKPKQVYDALFESAWQTINQFGKTKNVQLGMIDILHTWGQNLSLHPHLHCIIPGGGINAKVFFQKYEPMANTYFQ